MTDYVEVLTKLFENDVTTYDSIIGNITNDSVKNLFSKFISDYSSEMTIGNLSCPIFKRSLLNCIRLMDYVVINNIDVEFYIPREYTASNEITIHCGAYLNKGLINIQIVPGKNILTYAYTRRSEHSGMGMITATGNLKITTYHKNTSDALGLIFRFGE